MTQDKIELATFLESLNDAPSNIPNIPRSCKFVRVSTVFVSPTECCHRVPQSMSAHSPPRNDDRPSISNSVAILGIEPHNSVHNAPPLRSFPSGSRRFPGDSLPMAGSE
jgi:hypothetical protein